MRSPPDGLAALQGRLRYAFSTPAHLQLALTHSSHAHEHGGEHNERLEFLGDAVLELCVSALLLDQFPEAREGELSALRTRLVNTESLAAVARDLGLGELLRLGRGEDATGGRTKPSILEGAAEAVLGAVFLDGGYPRALEIARAWVNARVEALDEDTVDLRWKDPKSRLQEVVQRDRRGTPIYRVARTEGPDHAPSFTVDVLVDGRPIGHGRGHTKKLAERNAAECALMDLGERPTSGPAR